MLGAVSSGRTGEARGGARRVSVRVGRAAGQPVVGSLQRCDWRIGGKTVGGNLKDQRVAVALGKVERIKAWRS